MKETLLQKLALFTTISFLFISSAWATNYYVDDVNGLNTNSGLSQTAAKKTIQAAANLTNPGDTVFVMNGTYSTSPNAHDIVKITRSGTLAQPIVYKNLPGHVPFISFNVWNGILVTDGTAYIVIDGFKVRGNNSNVILNDATNQPTSCANPTGSPSPLYNGSGITVEGRDAGGHCHHVVIRNCEVYDCGTCGINALECDYITVENNLVYNNSWYTRYGGSGISFLHNWNFDSDAEAVKMVIRNNVVYGNQLFVPWRNGTVCEGFTDGNGIIYDDNRSSQVTNGIPYIGKALIENNVSYRNGGRGIHSFKSDNVTIRNNTTYANCKTPEIADGEITIITGSNIKVYNNIMYARAGKRANSASNFTNFSENFNIIYNSPLRSYYNTNDVLIDPLFVDTANNDFRLLPNSPAINGGTDTAGTFSPADLLGISRPQGSLPDMGAYEFVGAPSVAGNFTVGNIAALRVGNGTSVLNTDAAAANVLEYTPAGATTGINLPLSLSAAPNRIVLSGDPTSGEGQLNLSSDGRYLSLAGYEGATGTTAATYQANEKVIVRIGYNGLPDYTTRIAATTFNRTVRSAVTANSNRFFITGSNVSPATGNSTRFLSFGTPATTGTTAFDVSRRSLSVFKGQVYYANGNTVGSSTPNPSAGNYTVNVPFPGVAITGHNYQGMALLDVDAAVSYAGTGYDLLYCADQAQGLVKFYWNGTTWVFAGIFNPASATGVTGGLHAITARLNSAGNPEIFVVKGSASNNNIIAITDAGGLTTTLRTTAATAINVASAGAGYMFRGVAFSPSQTVILPVGLLTFSGYLTRNKVVLNWATTSEINAREFVVERSMDGSRFTMIGKTDAKNNVTGSSYRFDDENTVPGLLYYRLKLVDKDGSFRYSKTIVINAAARAENSLSTFPNPAIHSVSVSYPIALAAATLQIVGIDGKKAGAYSIVAGSRQLSLDVSELSSGTYLIIYTDGAKAITNTFIKQ